MLLHVSMFCRYGLSVSTRVRLDTQTHLQSLVSVLT